MGNKNRGVVQKYRDDLNATRGRLNDLTSTDHRLLQFLAEEPGCTIGELSRKFGWSQGTGRYYRDKLVRRNLVYCDRDDHPHRHYTIVGDVSEDELREMRLATHMKDYKRRRVLEWLQTRKKEDRVHEGWVTVHAVSEAVGMSRDFVLSMVFRLAPLDVLEVRTLGTRQQIRAVAASGEEQSRHNKEETAPSEELFVKPTLV